MTVAGAFSVPPPQDSPHVIHASTVALDGRAVLIMGRSGSGKSALALALMAAGARLVADDRTVLRAGPAGPVASAPASIAGRIEARGVGILHAEAEPEARVVCAVDLDRTERARLPEPRCLTLCGHVIRLFHKVESVHFAPAILQYLRCERSDA